MTDYDAAAVPVDPIWAAYTAAETQAQADYNAAVDEAQRHFALDAKPAIDTYHSVERAAWQRYVMANHAAKRRYTEAIREARYQSAAQPTTPVTDYVPPQDGPNAVLWPARPSFSPTQEREP